MMTADGPHDADALGAAHRRSTGDAPGGADDAPGGVAVVGLGDLGLAIARRLEQVGLAPAGVDGAPERRELWREHSGRGAYVSLRELAPEQARRSFVCVRTTDQAGAVLAELRELAAGAPSVEAPAGGAVAFLVTTLAPAFARELGAHADTALRVVELPVSGGRAGAERGELTALFGGPTVERADVELIERSLAARVFRFARYGEATLAKLLNNTLAAYNAAAFAHCVTLADAAGLDARECAAVALAGSGDSWIAEHFAALVDDLLAKDAALLAEELGPPPVLDLTRADELLAILSDARELLGRQS